MTRIGNPQSGIDNIVKVGLFVTCIVDQMWASVVTSTVEVLRGAGCETEFDERQTCCGQPAFNTGYRVEARQVAEQFIRLSEESDAPSSSAPSGSCTAMVHHYELLFSEDEEWRRRVRAAWFFKMKPCGQDAGKALLTY
ncbi:MAG: heterodisulfide reductase-related iron-sulfur binding cluster [Pyrinomonadaceae bacterium]